MRSEAGKKLPAVLMGVWSMKEKRYMKNSTNRGSAVIEMTILIPVLLACVYLYLMVFIHFVNYGKVMADAAEALYGEEWAGGEEGKIIVKREGKKKTVSVEEQDNRFTLSVELRKNENEPVKQIRRWQFAAELF